MKVQFINRSDTHGKKRSRRSRKATSFSASIYPYSSSTLTNDSSIVDLELNLFKLKIILIN